MVARATDGGDTGAPAGSETHPVVRLGFRPDGKRRLSVVSGPASLSTGDGAPSGETRRGVGGTTGASLAGHAPGALARQASSLNSASSSFSSFASSSAFPASLPFSSSANRPGFARPTARAASGAGRALAGRLLVRAFFDDMKTVSMQRINQKNAFQVDLIDRLALVVHQQLVKTDNAVLTDGTDGQAPALLDGASSPDLSSTSELSRTGRGEEGEEGITFTHVSSAVEGATRVYGYRVEAVYDQTYHVLNLMSSSRQGQGGEDAGDGDAAAHPTRRGRHHQQLALFKKGGASTLAPASEITESQIEKDSCVDPYFLKISGMFDQAGAKGLLLANLEVDTSLRMKLDGECRAFPTGVLRNGREKGNAAREETEANQAPEETAEVAEPSVDCTFLRDLLLAGETPAAVLALDICEKPIGHFRELLQSLRRGRDVKAGDALSEAEEETNELDADDDMLDVDMQGTTLGDSGFQQATQEDEELLKIGESYMDDEAASGGLREVLEAQEAESREVTQDDELFGDGVDFFCDGHVGDADDDRDSSWDRPRGEIRERDAEGERILYEVAADESSASSCTHPKSYSFDRLVPAFSQMLGVPAGGHGAQLAAKRAFGLVPTAAGPQGGGDPEGRETGRRRGSGEETSSSGCVDFFPLSAKGSAAAVGRPSAPSARLTVKERQLRKQEQFREMLDPFRVDMSNLDTKSGGLPLGSKFQCYVPKPQENVTVASDFTSSPFLHSPHLLVSLAMVPSKEIRLLRHTGPSVGDGWAPDGAGNSGGRAGRDLGRGDSQAPDGPWEATFIDAGDDGGLGDDSFWSAAAHGPLLKESALEAADAKAQTLLEGGGGLDRDWSDTAWAGGENDQASSYIAHLFERGDAASRGGAAGLSLGDIVLLAEPQKVGVSELRLSIPSRYVDVAVVKKALKTALGVVPDFSADQDAENSALRRKRKRDMLTAPGEEEPQEEDDVDSCLDSVDGETKEPCRDLALWNPRGRRDGIDFETLCAETTRKLPSTEKANLSPQMLFVCLLYTCNEETLHLEQSADFSSFSAFVHAPTDWHMRDDAEAVRVLDTVRHYTPLALPAVPEKKKKEILSLEAPSADSPADDGGAAGDADDAQSPPKRRAALGDEERRQKRRREGRGGKHEEGNRKGHRDEETGSKKRRGKKRRKEDSDESSDGSDDEEAAASEDRDGSC
uniref:Condensin complex subunit 2 n=1 Tax=Toxoplasma gondii TgCATBr9 TaxID=943120 RepID=A0A2T6IXQ4_TOXGO|nr:putative CCAAT-box DNA-binding subunit B, related protein [Toxoplasma gondii TgCATBr9]